MTDRNAFLATMRRELARWPGTGAGAEERRRAFLELDPLGARALDRDNYEPGHVTASAFVLSPDDSELLLIRHRKLGLWLQPGGHVEPGDADLTAAALRELEEETGVRAAEVLDPFFDLDVHRIPAMGTVPSHLHHDVRVLLRAEARVLLAGSDVDAARWFPLGRVVAAGAVLEAGCGTDESVRRVAQSLLQPPPLRVSFLSD